jgi:hypothetical protein
MSLILGILAALGVLALLAATFRASLRLLRGGVETFIAGEIANVRAGRGDLSGLDAAREWRASSRAARRLYAGQALGWLVLLIAPMFTPWTTEVYAACAALWLVPRRRRGRPAFARTGEIRGDSTPRDPAAGRPIPPPQ